MGLISAGATATLDRCIGYYDPATRVTMRSKPTRTCRKAKNVARAVANAVVELRAGQLEQPDRKLTRPRPK
jgi:hypothetical protein